MGLLPGLLIAYHPFCLLLLLAIGIRTAYGRGRGFYGEALRGLLILRLARLCVLFAKRFGAGILRLGGDGLIFLAGFRRQLGPRAPECAELVLNKQAVRRNFAYDRTGADFTLPLICDRDWKFLTVLFVQEPSVATSSQTLSDL